MAESGEKVGVEKSEITSVPSLVTIRPCLPLNGSGGL